MGLPTEVDAINRWAREALSAAGMRGTVEVGGWAVGDVGWFVADRPRLGVTRWDVATVVGVTPGAGRSAEVAMRVRRCAPSGMRAPREVTLRASELGGVRPGQAVPPYPSLVVGRGPVFVVGGLAPRLRQAQPAHLYVTGAVRGWDVGPKPDARTRTALRWASPGRLDELVGAARRQSTDPDRGKDHSISVAPGFVEAVRELRDVAERARTMVRDTGRIADRNRGGAAREVGRSR